MRIALISDTHGNAVALEAVLDDLAGTPHDRIAHLAAADLEWMRGFPATLDVPLGGGRRLCAYHGSPRSFDEIIQPDTPESDVRAMLDPRDDTIYAGGHTHVQFVRHLGLTFHMNPGSAGLAYRPGQDLAGDVRADPWAEYALLSAENTRLAIEFRRVLFDVDRLIAAYRASGRPDPDAAVRAYTPPRDRLGPRRR
ncbi:MAG: metallophosphoesterase family protein [Candidatus Eisenbacteria bacterium]|nr:metallophosphoesterase family protein [Candidatus Eisenbacteria bacterium]